MLDLNISKGPSSPLPLVACGLAALLLSLHFRCCRCFWNHLHPTIGCWEGVPNSAQVSIIPPHSLSLALSVYVAQHTYRGSDLTNWTRNFEAHPLFLTVNCLETNYPATEPPWTVLVGLGKPVSSHLSLNTDRPFTTRHPRHHRRQHSQVEIFGHNSSYVHMLWQLDNFKFMTYSYESLFGPSYTPALLLDSFKHVGADNGIAI
nr:hypothetical protein B13N20.90 [imported] - Neurospora crassa [Neurospora crassa]